MKVDVENLSDIKRKLRSEIPSEEVTAEVDRAYRDLGKKAKVKGFRPGKVPRGVLELYYKKQVEQDVSDVLVRRSLAEALKEQNLEPVGVNWPEPPPQVVAGADYHYSVELESPPEFEVSDYQGIKVAAPEVEVTEEEVDARLEEIRQHNAMLKPPAESRSIQEGDFVTLDYQAHFGGRALETGKAENYLLEVGAGKFNQDFERQVMGLAPGAEARFEVALPDDFFNPLLAGKVVEFEVKVHEVKEKVVPELDDDFARNLGGNFQGLPDLRAAVKEDIIKGRERERQASIQRQVLDHLLAGTQFEVPPSLVRREQEDMVREQAEQMQQYGMSLENLNPAKMMETLKPIAERRVKERLILERVAVQEKATVDEADVEEAMGRMAARSGRDVEQIRAFYREHGLFETLRKGLREEKTMKMLVDQAALSATETAAEAGKQDD